MLFGIAFYCFLWSFVFINFVLIRRRRCLPVSLQDPRRKDKYRHTHTHTQMYILCPYIEVGRRQWILMSWLDSASCFANSQTASYEFMSYKNSCWAAAPPIHTAGESEIRVRVGGEREWELRWGVRLKCPSFWLLLLLFLCFSHICWFYAALYFNYAPNGW